MENLPFYISAIFGFTTVTAIFLFYKATGNSKQVLLIIIAWMLLQSFISIAGFYTITSVLPPRFLLLIMPPLVFIIVLFSTAAGRKFIDSLNIKYLTLLHTIRIPVELVLLWLYMEKTIPQLMTFEGRNFDILAGITAPFVYYYGFIYPKLNNKIILLWNILCLGLLLNIVVNAVLSLPYSFQQFAFEQPNTALFYFPFTWLPAVLVPMVLFSHVAAIRYYLKIISKEKRVATF